MRAVCQSQQYFLSVWSVPKLLGGGDLEAWDVEGETGVSVLLPLSPQRGLQGLTHGEGQLCLVLVGMGIMPARNELFFFYFASFLHGWTHPICLGPKEWTVKMTQEREPDRALPRGVSFYVGAAGGRDTRAACWASGPGGTHGQEGRGKAKCQALGRGLWPPHLMSHLVLVSPEAMDCSCISLMNTLGLPLSAAEVVGVRSEVGVEWGMKQGEQSSRQV